MPQIYGTTNGHHTLTLAFPPGVAGTVGKKAIVLRSITGSAFTNALAAGTVYNLVCSDANGTVFNIRISPAQNTTTSIPINLFWPDNTGPRLYPSVGTPATIVTSATAGTTVSRVDLQCVYDYE